MNLGSAYALFAFVEGVVLRLSKRKEIWYGVLGAMLVCDVGHVFAVGWCDFGGMVRFGEWGFDEWVNYSTLVGGMVLRGCFLGGRGWV